jgi:hypothetical protein
MKTNSITGTWSEFRHYRPRSNKRLAIPTAWRRICRIMQSDHAQASICGLLLLLALAVLLFWLPVIERLMGVAR